MIQTRTGSSRWLRLSMLLLSYCIAVIGYLPPQRMRPIDFHFVLFGSLPLAGAWIVILLFCCIWFRKSGWPIFLGAPLALYWPLWLIFNRIPGCYYHHNCV